MDSKKAERLEKHKKEIRRKAYLNIFLTLVAGFGLGMVLWGSGRENTKFASRRERYTTCYFSIYWFRKPGLYDASIALQGGK